MSSWEQGKETAQAPVFRANTSPEVLRHPFFVQEATMAETLAKIAKVPKEKRRIIVYAGFHPNEGTDVLSRKHAQVWAERYNVLVVCQPTEETPHGLWKKQAQLAGPDGKIPPLPDEIDFHYEDIEKKFSLGDETFFINFHGTPIQGYLLGHQGPTRKRGMQFMTSAFYNRPEDFKDRRHPITFGRPDIAEGLESVVSKSGDDYENEVLEEPHQDDPRWYPDPANELTVEYFYEGKPVQVTDPDLQRVVAAEKDESRRDQGEETSAFYAPGKWDRQMKLGPSYLSQGVLAEEDIRVFDEVLSKDFEKMLAYIAQRLPEN